MHGLRSAYLLRGMETGPRPPRGPVSTGFLNFLRGMETISRIRVDAVVDCTFLNFLRGMETSGRGGEEVKTYAS